MSCTDSEIARHSENGSADNDASSTDAKKATTETKREATAITRRVSFSMVRPWSQYKQNHASCLSGFRRNSSDSLLQSPRKGSLQSSSFETLSRSLDSHQLRNLKTTSTSEETQQSAPKLSPLHARPFRQRRWTSPVAVNFVNSAVTSQSSPAQAASSNVCQNINDKIEKDNETEELTLQTYSHDQPSVQEASRDITTIEGKSDNKQERLSLSNSKLITESSSDTKGITDGPNNAKEFIESPSNDNVKEFIMETPPTSCCSVSKDDEKDADENILSKNHKSSPDTDTGDNNPEVKICKINDLTKEETTAASGEIEETFQQRNIYTEIKKNTKWSTSKKFRRRHHTIQTDTRDFMYHNLSTIVEQSSIGMKTKARNTETNRGGELQRWRSKSLDDITTLSEEAGSQGVFVQRLCSKSLCVPVIVSGNVKSKEKECVTTVKYAGAGEEAGRNSMNSINSGVQINKVNVQTFNYPRQSNDDKPQYRAVICGGQTARTMAETKVNLATPQHAVFTQAKPKWASITITQV